MNRSVEITRRPACSHQATLYLIIQILTVVLNITAVIILSQIKGYKGNTHHLVVRVLVLSDAIGAATTLTPILMSCLGYQLQGSKVCQALGFLSNVILLWTALIVLLMCTLRYFAVVKPLFYRTNITNTMVKWLLVALLFWSLGHIVLPLFGIGRFKFYNIGQYCSLEVPSKRHGDAILVHLIVWEGWVLMIFLIYCTARMVRELRNKRKLTSKLSFQQRRGLEANRMRQRGYTMMTVVIVAIYLVCYIPFLTYRAVTLFKKRVDESYHFHLHLLAHINPMLNPILYVSCNRGYKSAVRVMFGRAFGCFAEPIRRVNTSNSISLSLFSEDGVVAGKAERTRKSSSSAFLEVPSANSWARRSSTEDKPFKRRRGKRNSVDVSVIGSPTRGIEKSQGDMQAFGKSETRIEELTEANGKTLPSLLSQSSGTPLSSSIESSNRASPFEQDQERKPRGLSVSSIVYAVDSILVQRNVIPLPSFVIGSGDANGCKEATEVNNIIGSEDENRDDDIFNE